MKKSFKPSIQTGTKQFKKDIGMIKHDVNSLKSDMSVIKFETKTIRSTMVTKEEHKKLTVTVNRIYQILDSEARFINIIKAEHPILVKRVERIEDKLKLPHTLIKSG